VPGLQVAYEPPEAPDLIVHGDEETPQGSATRLLALLVEKGFVPT
jgi:adenylylsulfate kinase-like enzyme